MGKPHSRQCSIDIRSDSERRQPKPRSRLRSSDFIRQRHGKMAGVVMKRGKAREVLSRKVQFLGKFLSPVLDEVTMIKLRSHLRLSKGFRTKLRLTTHGISCGVKSTSFIRGKLPYDFTPLEDIQHLYIDQAYNNVLLCVSPYSGGQTEIVAYKFQADTDAKLFQQMYYELARKSLKSTTVPISTRSGYVEFDKQEEAPPGYDGVANWMFSQGDATEPRTLTNGFYQQENAGSSTGQSMSVQHSVTEPVTSRRQKTLQEAVSSRVAQTYESQAAAAAVPAKQNDNHHATAHVGETVTLTGHAHSPSSDTMLRDIDEISRELQQIRSLLVRGDTESLAEARRRIYQKSTNEIAVTEPTMTGVQRQSTGGSASALVPDHRRQSRESSDRGHYTDNQLHQTVLYTGTGRSTHDHRMSRGVARNLTAHAQVRSRSSDSHLRYGSRVPSQDSLSSERAIVSTTYVPAGGHVLRTMELQPLGQDHFIVYPGGTQRRSRSATRYDVVYR